VLEVISQEAMKIDDDKIAEAANHSIDIARGISKYKKIRNEFGTQHNGNNFEKFEVEQGCTYKDITTKGGFQHNGNNYRSAAISAAYGVLGESRSQADEIARD
jgi:hypothetical protein